MARARSQRLVSVFLTLIGLLFEPLRLRAQTRAQEDSHFEIPIRGWQDPKLLVAFNDALEIASRKLESAECQQLFLDFQDRQGRKLDETLNRTGRTGGQYLEWLIFYNGAHESDCAHSLVAASTIPGSRRVLICPGRFLQIYQDGPGYAAAVVIHEELHSLGLGENPPSSLQITERVLHRCGH